ncbi:MAG: hypothetical protein R3D33_11765 [Hyphomicrobiaceae bacterium]
MGIHFIFEGEKGPQSGKAPHHVAGDLGLERGFHFWLGASGRRYVHTVYSLIECPEVAAANYVIARRHADGSIEALSIARTSTSAPSLNLAEIRRRAAQLGGNEVHLHLLAEDERSAMIAECDMRAAAFAVHPSGADRPTLRLC